MGSEPGYGVAVHFDVGVEARDGTRLATDVYRPADPWTSSPIDDPKPALLVRTPYDRGTRDRVENHGKWYARQGYVVAIQDCRGRFDSEGEFTLLLEEPEDGYDTVEWLADRPYCDGSVGTMGTSYKAWVQNALAVLDPPHLAAMFVNQGGFDGWQASLRHHGAFEMRWLCWALTVGGGFAKRALEDPAVQRRLANVDVRDVLANEPVKWEQSPLRHVPGYEEWVFDLMTSDGDDPLWESPGINFEAYYDRSADVPTVYSGSWYDSYARATCENFRELAERKDSDHYLIMGPWTHGGADAWGDRTSGEVDLGARATRDYLETRLKFFDRYLKGEDTWDRPTVEYFTMGKTGRGTDRDGIAPADGAKLYHGGSWNTADGWPLPGTEFTSYYAHGDGRLTTTPPETQSSRTTYRFDPQDPVPTVGGNCSSYYTFEDSDETLREYPLEDRRVESITGRGGYDQRSREDAPWTRATYGPLEERNDVVVFRTPPLDRPVEIAGPIQVRIYASTDAPDTDFTAKLVDEFPSTEDHPRGFALNLSDSICRARYRDYRRTPDFVEPGEVYEFTLDPYPTANVFREGHRIRLDISSSNYPRYDVNHNTGDRLYGGSEYRVATNAVYHDRDHPTKVVLPVQPR